jgi:hypothetical protein
MNSVIPEHVEEASHMVLFGKKAIVRGSAAG